MCYHVVAKKCVEMPADKKTTKNKVWAKSQVRGKYQR
jgi:hypothetical protein